MKHLQTNLLAFVIPAYKAEYLGDTLSSLMHQTDKRFNVYVGDDDSPGRIKEVVDKFSDRLNISYYKFSENLGSKNLVDQWNRCLQLLGGEEWVCMLPDDDLLSPNTVTMFYKFIDESISVETNIVKLGLKIIDINGNIQIIQSSGRQIQNNFEFYNMAVRGRADSTLGDVIYRKDKLISNGGFQSFPKGWGSDHCTLIKVASGGLIYHLSDSYLIFRMSGLNISSDNNDGAIKMRARFLFGKWIRKNETVWDEKPGKEFYRFFFWKGEYYFLNVWKFSFISWWYLYKLYIVMNRSINPIPVLKTLAKKLIGRHSVRFVG